MANPTPFPNVARDAATWKFQQSYVERLMDHNALTAAHPDDTLILAGPPRHLNVPAGALASYLLPLGMMQQLQITQQLPTTPMQAIGSGRIFYVSGKAQGTGSIARLFVNGRNLLRALYTNAVTAGVDVTKFDDAASTGAKHQYWANLDSELFKIPFGLAVFFRDKIHDEIGAFYVELCCLNTWAVAVGAGQTMILENVNFMFDRIVPISTGAFGAAPTTYTNYAPTDPSGSAVFQSVFNQTGVQPNEPGGPNGADVIDNTP